MATLKDKLGIPESYTVIEIVIYFLQCLVFGIAFVWSRLAVVFGLLMLLYIFAYLPLAWAVRHLLGLISS